jgi:RHS repeat-associated protein
MCGWGSRSRRPRATRIYTLLPSALGGIISIREVNATGPNTDTWLGYDRLGSVCLTTDASGASNGLRWQDAYGNQLASVDTGAWASASDGYGFITKWSDFDVELIYGAQRWYTPQDGVYISASILGELVEHPYLYTSNSPVTRFDPNGLYELNEEEEKLYDLSSYSQLWRVRRCKKRAEDLARTNYPPGTLHNGPGDAFRHCYWSCCMMQSLGEQDAIDWGNAHEYGDPSNIEDEMLMDLWNNRIGRDLGQCDDTDCEDACKNAVESGRTQNWHDRPVPNLPTIR